MLQDQLVNAVDLHPLRVSACTLQPASLQRVLAHVRHKCVRVRMRKRKRMHIIYKIQLRALTSAKTCR